MAGTELKDFDKALPDFDALLDKATEATGGEFIKLDKGGSWVLSDDSIVDTDACHFKAFIGEALYGLTAWCDNEAVGEVLRPASEGSVDLKELGHLPPDTDIISSFALPLLCVAGPLEKRRFLYKSGGPSPWKAYTTLLTGARVRRDATPVIRFDASSYKHKKWGRIYTPEIHFVTPLPAK